MIAVLKPECVAEYEALHDGTIGPDPTEIRDAGIEELRIHRLGLTLVMFVVGETRAQPLPDEGTRARVRYDRTEACFAQKWQIADSVFSITAAGADA